MISTWLTLIPIVWSFPKYLGHFSYMRLEMDNKANKGVVKEITPKESDLAQEA
jgi:hypothetical protein